MSLWSALGSAYKHVVGAVEGDQGWIGPLIDAARNCLDHVFDGHPGAQAMPIPQIVKEIQTGYGSTDLHNGAQVADDQTRAQMRISDGSHDLVQRLESAWSGNGADAARENIRPLAVSADDASQTLVTNAQHVQTQADTFDRIRNSVQAMPDSPPESNWYDNLVPWTTDAENAVAKYNQQLSQNQQFYDQYHQSSTAVGQAIKIDYGHLPDDQNTQISSFQLDPAQQGKGAASGNQGPGSPGGVGGGPGGYHAPAGAGSYVLPAAAARSIAGPGGVPGNPGPSVGGYNPVTTTSGYNPSGNNSSSPPGSFGPAGGSGLDPSAGFAAPGFGPVGGGFGGGESEGRGYGAGPGARSGGSLQGGSRVGAGEGGGYAARPGAASAAGAAGAAGRPGMSGMGGGGAGKGKGEEDEEHETKYLVSEDGDETFGTDQKTTPPVIGL